jgi:hypothetical protein
MTMRGAYLFTSDPVAITITRAFMKGFAARGFPVVDRTAVTFAPPEPDQSTRLALAGEVVHFYARSVVSAEAPDTTVTVGCVVNLRIYGAAGGDPFWEGRYSKYEFTKEPFGGDLGIAFTRVLSKVIQNAMNDPTFLAQLRRTS